MEDYILSQFIRGAFDELVVMKNKDYYSTMEKVKVNIRANNIEVKLEKMFDRTIVRRVR